MPHWTCMLELDSNRSIISGNQAALCGAIHRGADLRIGTEFHHNEHVDTTSNSTELIREVVDFRVTYLLDNQWMAGLINVRQPISIPDGFGPRPSMSFFLYNQNGQQAIARPYLDGEATGESMGPSPIDDHPDMPKYHELSNWDVGTNAPSSNFIYDFNVFRYWVCDQWQEVLSHTADGSLISGSVDALDKAFACGCEVKVAVQGLCVDLATNPIHAIDHEVFIHTGSCYYYSETNLFIAASDPVIRVGPAIPLAYESKNWDFGWILVRTDGFVAKLLYDPYTLNYYRSEGRHPIRWFVR